MGWGDDSNTNQYCLTAAMTNAGSAEDVHALFRHHTFKMDYLCFSPIDDSVIFYPLTGMASDGIEVTHLLKCRLLDRDVISARGQMAW